MKRIVRLYPAAWRERYGDEMEALLEDRPVGPFDLIDLLLGAFDAHLHLRGLGHASEHRKGVTMSPMQTVISRNKLIALTASVAAVLLLAIGLITIDNIQYFDGTEDIVPTSTLMTLSMLLVAAGLGAVAAGFVVMRRMPAEGAALAVGGSLTAALMTYWLIVPLLVAAGVSAYAVRRARRFANP